MVDTISSAKSIRQAGPATSRYGSAPASASSPAATRPVAPVAASGDSTGHERNGEPRQDTPREQNSETALSLRLEVAEDGSGSERIYRFVDAASGEVVREWPAGEFGKLRDYMLDKKIHLLDKKV